ncbi:hypothetical protein GOBAR_AA04239 [Gossypium barbadense]|uniref:Uncharacterized protein n=1 Tax=Gossypium barbadense TaxID=3634 RepID=A0A2P5YL60_GOSBA|nr:hypothetical protein GOBAR_AA04239 [Gossypium barbadense]
MQCEVSGGGSSNSKYPPYGHNMGNEQLKYMLKNQQASVQGIETQIGQLAKLIFERPQGSLPSNTESNPREQVNTTTIQYEERLVAPKLEPRQKTVVSKGKSEVDHNDQKLLSKEYKPSMPYPNATRKDRIKEQFGKLTLRVGDKTIILQGRNSSNTSKIEGDCINHTSGTDHVVKPSVQKIVLKSAYKPCSSNIKGPIYEERRLQIEELDDWWTQKSRTLDKPKPHHDELNDIPNQLKVGDKLLLDTADPRVATSEPNEEIPLTVLSIFPYGTVEVIHPKFGTFKVHGRALGRAHTTGGDTAVRYRTMSSSHGKKIAIPASKKRKGAASSSSPTAEIRHPFLQTVMTNFDDPGMVQFHLGGLVLQLSVPEFVIALGLYTEEFMDDNELDTLHRHIYYSPSKCWKDLVPASTTYDPSRFKASALPPFLRYLHGTSSMLSMRMIEKRRGTYPPQYRLVQSTKEEDPEDITDDVPLHPKDPPSQPPPIHRPVHAAASYSDISEHLTRFKQ